MNAKEAGRIIDKLKSEFVLPAEYQVASELASIALYHEEKMERYAEMEAQEEVTLTLKDIMYIQNDVQTLEHLLHHLPDHIVDRIAFICSAEMQDRYEKMDKLEKECEA